MIRVSKLSSEYIRAIFTTNVDPDTLGAVHIGFSSDERTEPTAWNAGEVVDGAIRLQIGPGAVVVDPGFYTVWAKMVDSPEIPAEPVDRLEIY